MKANKISVVVTEEKASGGGIVLEVSAKYRFDGESPYSEAEKREDMIEAMAFALFTIAKDRGIGKAEAIAFVEQYFDEVGGDIVQQYSGDLGHGIVN